MWHYLKKGWWEVSFLPNIVLSTDAWSRCLSIDFLCFHYVIGWNRRERKEGKK